jgi:hypothetical protein
MVYRLLRLIVLKVISYLLLLKWVMKSLNSQNLKRYSTAETLTQSWKVVIPMLLTEIIVRHVSVIELLFLSEPLYLIGM